MSCTEAYKEHIMYTFNGFCKTVIRYAAINAWRERNRRRQKEISFEYLTEEKFYPLNTPDNHFPAYYEEYPVTICGQTIILTNGELAAALSSLPQRENGITPRNTKFETDKEKLHSAIRAALSSAISFEDFSGKLLQQGVTVKESRGRLSYLTPDRTKPITARKLGDDFDRAAVLERLALNAQEAKRAAEKPLPKQEYSRSIKDRLQRGKAAVNAPKQNSVQRMVDREAKRAEGKGIGWESNLLNFREEARLGREFKSILKKSIVNWR